MNIWPMIIGMSLGNIGVQVALGSTPALKGMLAGFIVVGIAHNISKMLKI